jgi:WD40 repeat protein
MAPEQAGGKTKDIGPAADVYALGAILYECLTGRPPFRAATPWDTILQVIHDEPVPPVQLQSKVPRDLQTICLKCLRKEQAKRYASAVELAEDLHRFQGGKPVRARPVGLVKRSVKWIRRRPGIAGLLAALILIVTAGFGLVTWKWRDAVVTREQAEFQLYCNRIALAGREYELNRAAYAWKILDQCPPERRGWEWLHIRRLCHITPHATLRYPANVRAVALSPDARRLATITEAASGRQELRVRNAATGRVSWTAASTQAVTCLAFSADGRELALATWGAQKNVVKHARVEVRDAVTGKLIRNCQGHDGLIRSIAYSPDGRQLASASSDATVKVWDLETGKQAFALRGHTREVSDVAYADSGRRLLSAGADNTLRVWDLANGRQVRRIELLKGYPFQLAPRPRWILSPTGQQLAGLFEQRVYVWDVATGKELITIEQRDLELEAMAHPVIHSVTVLLRSVVFSPDGQRIALVSECRGTENSVPDGISLEDLPDKPEPPAGWGTLKAWGEIHLWDLASHRRIVTLRGHSGAVQNLAFGQSGTLLASCSDDRTVRLWEARAGESALILRGHTGTIHSLAVSPDSRWLASADRAGLIKIWDLATGQEVRTLRWFADSHNDVIFGQDGKWLGCSESGGFVMLWDLATGRKDLTSWKEARMPWAEVPDGNGRLIPKAKGHPGGRYLASLREGNKVDLLTPLLVNLSGSCGRNLPTHRVTSASTALASTPTGASLRPVGRTARSGCGTRRRAVAV